MTDDTQILQIPVVLLMGCHNCRWKENAMVCLARDQKDDCWENDGAFDPSSIREAKELGRARTAKLI